MKFSLALATTLAATTLLVGCGGSDDPAAYRSRHEVRLDPGQR